MNVVAPRTLRDFWTVHPHAEAPLKRWYRIFRRGTFTAFNEVRDARPTADYLPEKHTPDGLIVFNVAGNAIRVVTFIRFSAQTIFIKHVFTHPEYTRWSDRRR